MLTETNSYKCTQRKSFLVIQRNCDVNIIKTQFKEINLLVNALASKILKLNTQMNDDFEKN